MKAEFITLMTAMSELIGFRELINEVYYMVLKYSEVNTVRPPKPLEQFPNPFSINITSHVVNFPQSLRYFPELNTLTFLINSPKQILNSLKLN